MLRKRRPGAASLAPPPPSETQGRASGLAPSRGTPWTRHSSPSLASETRRAACSACRWGLTCVSGRSAGCARGRRTRRRRRRHRLLREAEPAAAGKRVQWKRDSASMLGRDTRQCSSQRCIRVTGHRLPSTKLPDGPGEGHGSSPDPCPGRAPALHEANFFHPLHKYWWGHCSRRRGGC